MKNIEIKVECDRNNLNLKGNYGGRSFFGYAKDFEFKLTSSSGETIAYSKEISHRFGKKSIFIYNANGDEIVMIKSKGVLGLKTIALVKGLELRLPFRKNVKIYNFGEFKINPNHIYAKCRVDASLEAVVLSLAYFLWIRYVFYYRMN